MDILAQLTAVGLTILGGAVAWVVRTIVANSARLQRVEAAREVEQDNKKRVGDLETALSDLRVNLAECYVRRDDHVTVQSRVIGLLESHSVALARLETRIGQHEEAPR